MTLLTMQPVLRRGRSVLDRRLLPGDECELRLELLLQRAAAENLDGVLVFGNAHEPENLAYFANYTPTTFVGVIVARPGQPPVLIAGKGGARDHPYIRTVSWISDIRYFADHGAGIREIVSEWGGRVALGTVGLDTAPFHWIRQGVVEALAEQTLHPVDGIVADFRRTKSPRELAVLREAHRIAADAAAAAAKAFAEGAGPKAALAAAEFVARRAGAHDCRPMAGTGGKGLVPVAELDEDSAELGAVVAVEYLGYWGLQATTLRRCAAGSDDALERDVASRASALAAGARLAELVGDLPPEVLIGGYGYSVAGIGCGLQEVPFVPVPGVLGAPGAPGGRDPLPGEAIAKLGDVVSLIGWHGSSIASRTVVVGVEGSTEL